MLWVVPDLEYPGKITLFGTHTHALLIQALDERQWPRWVRSHALMIHDRTYEYKDVKTRADTLENKKKKGCVVNFLIRKVLGGSVPGCIDTPG